MQGFHEIHGEGSSWAGEQCAAVCGPSRHHPAHRHGQTVHCLLPSLWWHHCCLWATSEKFRWVYNAIGATLAPCADGSHSCYHPIGIIGGKFLERGRIAKPKIQGADPIVYYQAEDLYVGSRVELNRHKFVLIDTDEYALRYMEKHCDQVWKCWVLLSRHILEWIEHISQHTFSY